MPRPLNWIRGEGTVKNQRGLGAPPADGETENTVSIDLIPYPSDTNSGYINPYVAWMMGSNPNPDTMGIYNMNKSNAPSVSTVGNKISLGMIVAIGVGLALVLRR